MKTVLGWIGRVLLGLLGLLVAAVVILNIIALGRVNKTYDVEPESIVIPSDQASIDRGQHIAAAISICQACHGAKLEGQVLDDEPFIVRMAPPNLTSGQGGLGGTLTDADYVLAIRHGLDPNRHPLMIMHSDYFHNLSQQDLGAVIAYVKSVPPVDNQVPETAARIVGRALLPLGVFDSGPAALLPAEVIDHQAPFNPMPAEGTTPEYGQYLVSIALCQMCHGPDLTGGPPIDPASPAGPNIAAHAAAGGWTEQQFIDTIRSGVTPEGRTLNADAMPFEYYGKMTDQELQAIWAYLGSLSN